MNFKNEELSQSIHIYDFYGIKTVFVWFHIFVYYISAFYINGGGYYTLQMFYQVF